MSRKSDFSVLLGLSLSAFSLLGCSNGSTLSPVPSTPNDAQLAPDAVGMSSASTAMAAERTGETAISSGASAAPQLSTTESVGYASSGISERPGQADAFVNSVGVDSHFVYSQMVYSRQFSRVSQLLISSGIKHIRDNGPAYDKTYLNKMAMLSAHGIHHSVGFGLYTTGAQMSADLRAFDPDTIDFVEGQNEYDTYGDPNWAAKVVAQQKLIWKTVRSSPAFNSIAVLGPALGHQQNYAVIGPLDAYEDAGNLHNATCNYNPGTTHRGLSIAYMTPLIRDSTVTKPIWTTETGYDDNSPGACLTPDSVIAKYDPRLIAVRWNFGEPRSYIFSFADDLSDRPFGNMGLIFANATPKPQYTAIQSMLLFLADPGPRFMPAPVTYALYGQTRNIHHTLLQKRDGTCVLMLWIEQPSIIGTQNSTERLVKVPPQQVSISVAKLTSAKNYDYDTSNWKLKPTALSINGQTIRLTVTDAISFLEFTHR